MQFKRGGFQCTCRTVQFIGPCLLTDQRYILLLLCQVPSLGDFHSVIKQALCSFQELLMRLNVRGLCRQWNLHLKAQCSAVGGHHC